MNIENEYYQAKAAKEDNPQAAITGFERVGLRNMYQHAECLLSVCVYVHVGSGVGGQKR